MKSLSQSKASTPLNAVSNALFIRSGRALSFTLKNHRADDLSAYELALFNLTLYVDSERQWWSRSKVYVCEPISPSMWGVMKVAGKRLYQVSFDELNELWMNTPSHLRRQVELNDLPTQPPLTLQRPLIPPPRPRFKSIHDAVRWLRGWVDAENVSRLHFGQGELPSQDRRWRGTHRTVGAIALDHDLRLVAYSLNRPTQDHTAHAERLVLETLKHTLRAPLPELHLISSLKPCKMCAGLWLTHAPTEHLKVYYLREDFGKNGQNTALDENSYAWSAAKRWRSSPPLFSQVKIDDIDPASESLPDP